MGCSAKRILLFKYLTEAALFLEDGTRAVLAFSANYTFFTADACLRSHDGSHLPTFRAVARVSLNAAGAETVAQFALAPHSLKTKEATPA